MRKHLLHFALFALSTLAVSSSVFAKSASNATSSTNSTPQSPGAQIHCDPNTNASVFAKLKDYETKIKNAQNEQDRKNLVAAHQQAAAQLQCTYVSTQAMSRQ